MAPAVVFAFEFLFDRSDELPEWARGIRVEHPCGHAADGVHLRFDGAENSLALYAFAANSLGRASLRERSGHRSRADLEL